MERNKVYKLIDGERAYQDKMWNENTTDSAGKHTPTEWLLFMEDYMREAMHIASRNPEPLATTLVMNHIRKITAMGINCMEQNDCPPREGINITKDVLILTTQAGDWEGLFINGVLIEQGHKLGEGYNITYLISMAETHHFQSVDIRIKETNAADEEYMDASGQFPNNLNELKGTY